MGNYDKQDESLYTFYNCTLKENIGPYKIGDKFSSIDVDFREGKLSINKLGVKDKDGFARVETLIEVKLKLSIL